MWAIIVFELRELAKDMKELKRLIRELLHLLRHRTHDNVTGGTIYRIGDNNMPDTFGPLQPGVTATFQVSPTFTGDAFTLDGTKAAVESSDPTNFPVSLDPADVEGRTIVAAIPTTATPVGGSEVVTIDWSYTNADGLVAHVTGTVTEVGIVDDVTGGTFTRIS